MRRGALRWALFAAAVASLAAPAASHADRDAQRAVRVVGRFVSAGGPIPEMCAGEDTDLTLEYEVVFARPSERLHGRVRVSVACAVLDASRALEPQERRPQLAAGELHDLQLRGTPLRAVSIEQRTAPVAGPVSVAIGYDRELVARVLERKLAAIPCRSAGGEMSLTLRLRIKLNDRVSLKAIDPAASGPLGGCLLRSIGEWDFGYSEADERERAELAFVLILPREPASRAAPVPFDAWSMRAPESVDWDGRDAVNLDWYVDLRAGRVVVSSEPPPERARLPFEVERQCKDHQMELGGEQHVARVDGGYLVGFNAGEWGGGAWWFSPDGRRRRKLTLRSPGYFAENVHGFASLGSDVLAFEGLTHNGYDGGQVVRLHRGPDGEWQPSVFAELETCPEAVVSESASSWLLATSTGIWRLDSRARVAPVWRPPGGHLYYPNSIVRDADGLTYMGMRNLVVRLTPQTVGRYTAHVLVPPARH